MTPATPSREGRAARQLCVAGILLATAVVAATAPSGALSAQEEPRIIELTLENMVALTMSSSYTIRRLNLEIDRRQHELRADRARLKTSIDMELTLPALRLTSEPKWNSTLQKNEIIRENTRRWEGEISIRQPVILFGYPTNGYLSFNNRLYRYNQIDNDGVSSVSYYNRYYISYTQPLFQPNTLKNNLEQAELNLEITQLNFYRDIVNITTSVSDGYHSILEQYYRRDIRQARVAALERALGIAEELARADTARSIDVIQLQVELANAREQLQSSENEIRLTTAFVKREYGLAEDDSLVFEPVFELDPVEIDMDAANRYGRDLTPGLRQLAISLRRQEIDLDRVRTRNGFRLNLNLSYGRETRDDVFGNIWVRPDNSYTINISAFVPVWDWGERKSRMAATRLGIDQTRLRIEETELGIVSGVRNEVLNVRDRESRTLAMQDNLELARNVTESSFRRYEDGTITAQDLLLSIQREVDTAENFLDAYVSWKGSLASLRRQTYFDFEKGRPVIEWFREEGWITDDFSEG